MSRTAADLDTEILHEHGLLPAVPLDLKTYLADAKASKSTLLLTKDIPLPDTPLAKAVTDFAREKLTEPCFNHSMRVYYFGQIMRRNHVPTFRYSDEVALVLSLLHDLGTAPTVQPTSVFSFEYQGGIKARELLLSHGAPESLADSVAEAIFRHQDVGTTGMLSALGGIIQLSTSFDNMGHFPDLVHSGSVDDVVAKWPRLGWSGCFNKVIQEEGERKPWSHTSVIGFAEFQRMNTDNPVMKRFADY